MNNYDFEILEAAIKYLELSKVDIKSFCQDIGVEFRCLWSILLGEKTSDEIGRKIMSEVHIRYPEIMRKAMMYSHKHNNLEKTLLI